MRTHNMPTSGNNTLCRQNPSSATLFRTSGADAGSWSWPPCFWGENLARHSRVNTCHCDGVNEKVRVRASTGPTQSSSSGPHRESTQKSGPAQGANPKGRLCAISPPGLWRFWSLGGAAGHTPGIPGGTGRWRGRGAGYRHFFGLGVARAWRGHVLCPLGETAADASRTRPGRVPHRICRNGRVPDASSAVSPCPVPPCMNPWDPDERGFARRWPGAAGGGLGLLQRAFLRDQSPHLPRSGAYRAVLGQGQPAARTGWAAPAKRRSPGSSGSAWM
eukprot:gene13777-biopygen6536